MKEKLSTACSSRKADIVACWLSAGEAQPEVEADCFCNHGLGASGVDIDCSTSSGNCRGGREVFGSCMKTERGSWARNCHIYVCPMNCLNLTPQHWVTGLMHELMHCCGAGHDSRNRLCQADPWRLERCLAPVLGLDLKDIPKNWTDFLNDNANMGLG